MRTIDSTIDPYKILGIDGKSDDSAIRVASKRASLLNHPDRNPNNPNATARMKKINNVYAILMDQEARRAYDEYTENTRLSCCASFDPGE